MSDNGAVPAQLSRDATAKRWTDLAQTNAGLGDYARALAFNRRALSIRLRCLDVGDPLIAQSMRDVARNYLRLGEYAFAALYAEKALSAMGKLRASDPALLPVLSTLSASYTELGRFEEARDCAERAQAIADAEFGADNVRGVPALESLELAFRAVGRFREAFGVAERAVKIQRKIHGERSLEAARALSRLAVIVAQIGDAPRAQQMFQQALEVLLEVREVPRHRVENELASVLTNLAGTHLDLGHAEEALPLYDEALSLRKRLSGADHPETVRLYSQLGLLYCVSGKPAAALEMWQKSLELRRKRFGILHPDVARSLLEVASLHLTLGDTPAAKRAVLEGLAVLTSYEAPAVTARAWFLLAAIIEPRSLDGAIFFAKVAVNAMQTLRSDAASIGQGADRAFVESREPAYRLLGEALIIGGRLPEARQVLGMLKEAELHEITLEGQDPRITRAEFTLLEALWARRSEEVRTRIKSRFAPYAITQDHRSLARDRRRPSLRKIFNLAATEMERWLGELVADFSGAASLHEDQTASKRAARPEIPADDDIIPKETALIQYLLSQNHLRTLLTARGLERQYEIRLMEGEINRLVYAMRTAIRERTCDFLASARRLYDILIRPLVPDLSQLGIDTLAVSMDGALRYLPVAALHEGARYLIDDFAIMLAVNAPAGRVAKRPLDPRACGLGVTRAFGSHSALNGVREELQAVIRSQDSKNGILPGVVRIDEAFTVEALHEALASGYSVVHIASHFVFRAAEEASSYLLLGDGTTLSLAELARLEFHNIDLLVLSACDTAMGGGHRQSGREVEGLGALAHRQGAANVVATLWPVADFATVPVMQNFYRNWHIGRLSPQKALRRAQLAVRDSGIPFSPLPTRGIEDPDNSPGGQAISSLSHPYYWAPYLLMSDVTAS